MLNNALNPVAFTIGGLEVKWYAIILVSGMIAGLIYIILDGKRYKLSSDFAIECWLWCIVLAIIFARFFYVVAHPSIYFPIESWDDFLNLFKIWNGGITILGGILGGILGAYIASVRYKRNFLMVCDYCAPAVLIGQIIGRWGNYVNQEAYGIVVTNPDLQWFPFSVYIDQTQQWHCATFFYEIVLNAIGFVALYLLSRKVKHNGIIAGGYIFWYCVVRAILETLRLDAVVTDSGLRVTQLICIIFAVISFTIIMLIHFKVFDKIDKKGWLLKAPAVAAGDIPLKERKKKKKLSDSKNGKDNYAVENNADRFNEIVNGILEEKKKLKEENALKEEKSKSENTEKIKSDENKLNENTAKIENANATDLLYTENNVLTDIQNESVAENIENGYKTQENKDISTEINNNAVSFDKNYSDSSLQDDGSKTEKTASVKTSSESGNESSAKSGSSKTGTAKKSTAKTNTAKKSTAKTGTAKKSTVKSGTAKSGSSGKKSGSSASSASSKGKTAKSGTVAKSAAPSKSTASESTVKSKTANKSSTPSKSVATEKNGKTAKK